MTVIKSTIENKEGFKGEISLEDKVEALEKITKVKFKNGDEQELFINEAFGKMLSMMYEMKADHKEIKESIEVLIDVNKVWRIFKKYRKPIVILLSIAIALWYGVAIKTLFFKWLGL